MRQTIYYVKKGCMLPDMKGFGQKQHPERLLLIRLDNIGDIIMLGPALRAIRDAFPQAQLTLMASPAGAQAASLLPWIDETITWSAAWQDVSGQIPQDPARELGLVKELETHHFDAAFIFTSFTQSPYPPAYACYLAGIPIRIGQSKEFGGSLLTHWSKPPADSGHQVDRNLALLEIAGVPYKDKNLELHIPEEDVQTASDLLQKEGIGPESPYVLAAPGASCAARRYDPQRFAAAVRILSQKSGMPVIIAGSAHEAERLKPVLDQADKDGKIVSLVGKTRVPQLASVIRSASLIIANNSASLHIADAFQRPMVILYSGTEYESQWEPRSSPARLLRRPTDCSPCFQFDCPYEMECLDIPPEEVVESALDVLNQTLQFSGGFYCKSHYP
jgi:ADP-heptose:LPS heptosyltransferase